MKVECPGGCGTIIDPESYFPPTGHFEDDVTVCLSCFMELEKGGPRSLIDGRVWDIRKGWVSDGSWKKIVDVGWF